MVSKFGRHLKQSGRQQACLCLGILSISGKSRGRLCLHHGCRGSSTGIGHLRALPSKPSHFLETLDPLTRGDKPRPAAGILAAVSGHQDDNASNCTIYY